MTTLQKIEKALVKLPDYSKLDNLQQAQVYDSALVAVAAYGYGLSGPAPIKIVV
jgi:hypothetical protein